jgi:small subunit ribosomal protein S11
VPAKRAKKKVAKQVPHAHVHVHASFNNTIVTVTDTNGNTLAWSSAGHMGFKGPKKSTPFAASQVIEDVIKKVADYGVKEVNVFVRGIGSGRDSAVRTLHAAGVSVASMKDSTPTPHNGCRPPKPRRL